MKTMLQAGSFILALALGGAGALAQTNPGNQPPPGKGQPKSAPAAKAAPPQAGSQAAPNHPGPQTGPTHAGSPAGDPSMKGGFTRPQTGPSRDTDGRTMQQPGYARQFKPGPRLGYGVANRWGRAPGYARPYGMRPQRFVRYGENPATWSPRYRRTFVQRGYGYHGTLRYGYEPRYRGYAARPAYDVAADERRLAYRGGYRRGVAYTYRRPAYSYAPRFSYYGYGYRPRVRYAYAETPYAYDLPRETYATGIFATNAAIGLHTYEYAYTTRVRPIAAYGGATGSYAGGYPIYNRPLAPAYPTPSCDCD
jgi:hypothetical protein